MNDELKDILKLAISFEEESFAFYDGLRNTIENRAIYKILEDLAKSEVGHKTKLENLLETYEKTGDRMFQSLEPKDVEDMKLGDFLLPMKLAPDSSFQDVLIAAMKREGGAHEFYVNMRKLAGTEESKKLFGFLSMEELEHKNIIEKLYDDHVYQEF